MKIYILLTLALLQSCSSTSPMQVHKMSGVSTELQPYVEDFKVNHPTGEQIQVEIPVNFSNTVLSHGVCYLRMDLADREILVNRVSWDTFPQKREYIMNYLLSSCYGTNPLTAPTYEVHVRGL